MITATATTTGTIAPAPIPPKPPMVRPSDPEQLPRSLRELPRFVLWKYEWVEDQKGGGRWTKVPYRTDRRHKAKTDSPTTWADFDEAFAAMLGSQEFGLGFVFSVEDDITGIDFDRCLDSAGRLKPWAREFIEQLAFTYLEISPSGSGLKAFVRADLKVIRGADGGCRGHLGAGEVELYSEKSFFTLTGQAFSGSPLEIEEHAAVVRAILAKLGKLEPSRAKNGSAQIPVSASWRAVGPEDVDEVQQKLACALENLDVKFRDTYNGSADWYRDGSGRPDPSAADCGFYFDLADMFRGDAAKMYAAFMMTPRGQREKAQRLDYQKRTLKYVLEHWEPRPELDTGAGVESKGTEAPAQASAPSPPSAAPASPSEPPPSPEPLPEPQPGPGGTQPTPPAAGTNPDGYAHVTYVMNGNGGIRPLLANAELALRKNWRDTLAFNEFSYCVTTRREPPRLRAAPEAPWMGSKPGEPWTDTDDRLAACWLQRNGIFVSDEVAGKAVMTVAQQMRFHPVRQFLDELKWDGKLRLDNWLTMYLGIKSTSYTRAVGARWLVAAVARIYRPGCKVDCCLILEGPQGAKKSTALRALFTPWFTDEIADLGTKDAALQTRGVWGIELSELDAMTGGEVSRVKAFMSRNADRFRPPYGRMVIDSPRQCVFAGTVNHSAYLKDETGGRRFWPVQCGALKIEDLECDRSQLLAEAVARYRQGAIWWLDSVELNELATKEQGDRYEGDPWDEIVRAWVERPTIHPNLLQLAETPHLASTPESVTISEILQHAVGKRPELWMQADKNRIARILRSFGYERYRERGEEKSPWCYRPKKKE